MPRRSLPALLLSQLTSMMMMMPGAAATAGPVGSCGNVRVFRYGHRGHPVRLFALQIVQIGQLLSTPRPTARWNAIAQRIRWDQRAWPEACPGPGLVRPKRQRAGQVSDLARINHWCAAGRPGKGRAKGPFSKFGGQRTFSNLRQKTAG